MTRPQWRAIAAKAQRLAKVGGMFRAVLYLRMQTGCSIPAAWHAVKRLRSLPEVKP